MPLLLILLFCFTAFAAVPESGILTSRAISRETYGTPQFTDPTIYNEYDFCGSPLGLFEKESAAVHIDLAYRSFSLTNAKSADSGSSASVPVLPNLIVGKRDILYIGLNYEPAWLERKTTDTTLSLSPLHRFGLTVAAETPSKYLRFGIEGRGYTGTLHTSVDQNVRTVMGLTKLRAVLGSQVHPLVRLGIYGGATGNFDSLQDNKNQIDEDRFFYGSIPYYGGNINVGMDGIPVQSNFSLDFASNHFVYVTKPSDLLDGNEDALVGDSLAWQWQTLGKFGYAGFTYMPALSLEYWRNKIQKYAPGTDNYPLQYKAARSGMNWTFSSFTLGAGASSLLQAYGKCWLEYSHQFFNASYGAGVTRPGADRGYDRIGLGLEGNVHAIPGLRMPSSMEMFLRLGYCNMRQNSRFGAFHGDEFRQFSQIGPGSQFVNDNGAYGLGTGGDERITDFSMGAGTTFFNRTLTADVLVSFLSREASIKENGVGFGIGVEYFLKAAKEK
jgi:hypothetical protein